MGNGLLSRLSSITDVFSSETAVGLSIGSSSIKIAELKKQGKQYKLLQFGVMPISDDVVNNREIVNPLAVSETIQQLGRQLKLKTKNICSSLSGPSVIIKRFQLEVPNKKELQDQVFWEAEQYLPFDVSEVVMDFQVVGEGKDGKTDVVLVAVKRKVVEDYLETIQKAGFKAKIIDTDYFALQDCYETNYSLSPSEAVALVDIGSVATKIVIVQNNIPIFTKDSLLGGRYLTAEIQKQLNISFADAEALKVGEQNTVPQEVSELIQISCDNVAAEVKRAIDFYNASSIGAPVSVVLLTGGGSKLNSLSANVEAKVGRPTQILNPFNNITYDPQVFTPDYIASIAPFAAVPVGLAIRAGAK